MAGSSDVLEDQRVERFGADFVRLKSELDNKRLHHMSLKVRREQLNTELTAVEREIGRSVELIKGLEQRIGKAGRLVKTAERALPYFVMDALDRLAEEDGTAAFRDTIKKMAHQLKDQAMLEAADVLKDKKEHTA